MLHSPPHHPLFEGFPGDSNQAIARQVFGMKLRCPLGEVPDQIVDRVFNHPVLEAQDFVRGTLIHVIEAMPPATTFAQLAVVAGTSTPAESIPVFAFHTTTTEYMDYKCWMDPKYKKTGVVLRFRFGCLVATNNVRWGAAFRRIEDSDDLDTTAHTYDYNDVAADVAVPATVGKTTEATITFTDGADMDNVAAGELFILRVRRTTATSNATDDALLYGVTGREA